MGSWVPAEDPSHQRCHPRGPDGEPSAPLCLWGGLCTPGVPFLGLKLIKRQTAGAAGLTSLYCSWGQPLLCKEGGSSPPLSKQAQPFSQLQPCVDHATAKATALQRLVSLTLPGESKHSLG